MNRLAMCVALSVLVACANSPAAASSDTAAVSIEEDPSSLDTVLNTPFGWQLAPLTQGYLFLVDARGDLVPDRALAVPTRANGGISADGLTIIYKLRTGRWSDGAPFDARDVAFTVAALRNPATDVPDRSTIDRIASVAAPNPGTLVIRLRAPYAPFVSSFLTLGAEDPYAIVPRHIARRFANLNSSSLDTQPVGLGPFRLIAWQRGERLEFAPNPFYWRGPPKLARLDVLVEPNAETRLIQMRTGALDETYISGLLVDQARQSRLRVVEATTNIVDYLQFNFASGPLAELRFRRAIAQAIDRKRLAESVYRGLEEPVLQPPFDPVAARRVLAGAHLNLDFAIAGAWRSSNAAAALIADDLQRAGVSVTIKSYATATFWGPKSAGGILERGRFDVALTSWSPGIDPDRSYLFDCDAVPPAGGNAGGYCDRAFDEAEARGMHSYDPAVRAAAYREAAAIFARDVPIVPLGFERSAYALSRRLQNFKPNPLGRDFWNAWEWNVSGR